MKKIMTIEIYTKETGRKRKEGEENGPAGKGWAEEPPFIGTCAVWKEGISPKSKETRSGKGSSNGCSSQPYILI